MHQTNAKFALAVLLALFALAHHGLTARQPQAPGCPKETARTAPAATFAGRVLNLEGLPVRGADYFSSAVRM